MELREAVATTIRESVEDLNAMILGGQILDAFDKYYDQNVVMQDIGNAERQGFDACRQFEVDFVNNLTEFRGAKVKSVAVDEKTGVVAVEWFFDYTHKEWGDRTYDQVALQQWKDGKIVREVFYHA